MNQALVQDVVSEVMRRLNTRGGLAPADGCSTAADVGNQTLVRRVRRRLHGHLERLPVANDEIRVFVRPHIGIGRTFLKGHAGLQRVRSGDICERGAVRAERRVIAREIPGVGAEVDTGRLLGDRIAERRRRVLDRFARPGFVHRSGGGLEQRARRQR